METRHLLRVNQDTPELSNNQSSSSCLCESSTSPSMASSSCFDDDLLSMPFLEKSPVFLLISRMMMMTMPKMITAAITPIRLNPIISPLSDPPPCFLLHFPLLMRYPFTQVRHSVSSSLHVKQCGMVERVVLSEQHSSSPHGMQAFLEFNLYPLAHPKQLFKSELHE